MDTDKDITEVLSAGQSLMQAREAVAGIDRQIAEVETLHKGCHDTVEWFTATQPEAPDNVREVVMSAVEAHHLATSALLIALRIEKEVFDARLRVCIDRARNYGIEV